MFTNNLAYDTRFAHRGLYDAFVPAVRNAVHRIDSHRNRNGDRDSLATTGDNMTETHEMEAITEAMSIIDRALGEMLHRELVSTNEVADLLLDIRTLLSHEAAVLVQN
jgi:hypothetical protein